MPSLETFFQFQTEAEAQAAAKAVSPELTNTFEKRSRAGMHTNKNVVSLKIVAQDETALRASQGFYSRLFGLCREISLLRR